MENGLKVLVKKMKSMHRFFIEHIFHELFEDPSRFVAVKMGKKEVYQESPQNDAYSCGCLPKVQMI